MTGLNIGTNIREHRRALSMPQEELAAICMVSRQTVSNWETGKTLPDVHSLKYLAAAFGTTVDELLADDGPEIARRSSIGRYEFQAVRHGGVRPACHLLDACRPRAAIRGMAWVRRDGWGIPWKRSTRREEHHGSFRFRAGQPPLPEHALG